MSYSDFANRVTSVADALAAGRCGGSYAEACILVSALVSGIAADLWPGTGIDRRRFVEAWARHADASLLPVLVSTPLLHAHLVKENRHAEVAQLQRLCAAPLGNDARVITGEDVDCLETAVLECLPALPVATVREFTYPSIFYQNFRSGLLHEYQTTGRSTATPMTTRPSRVSYANHLDPPVGRRIHFHLPWLIEVARSIATSAETVALQRPLRPPSNWWIDGG